MGSHVDTFVFDKTGRLAVGLPEVRGVYSTGAEGEGQVTTQSASMNNRLSI
jgi:cation transport ATPase